MSTPRRAVFLDRDGTVIVDVGYPRDPELVELLPGALDGMRALARAGFALVIVSNQSGVGRGLIAPAEARRVHERFVALLADGGVHLDAARYCPHAPAEECRCRKPSPAMLRDAASELDLDLARSWMVGDRASDVEAGRAAGCRTILLSDPAGRGDAGADRMAEDWPRVTEIVLGEGR